MAKQYLMDLKYGDGSRRSQDISLVSVPGFPEGTPRNNNAAINKALGYIAWHNSHLQPHESLVELIQVKSRQSNFDVLWSKFTA